MKRVFLGLAIAVCLAAPRLAVAEDPWDASFGPHADDNSGTDNEIQPGAEQIHDLQSVGGIADFDWYLVGQQPYSSYEVIADGLTEEIALLPITTTEDAMQLDLVDSSDTLVQSGYGASSLGVARSLRFRNTTASEITNNYVRVRGGTNGCAGGPSCTANARYRILLRETTMLIPRFNNSGTQITIVIIQNGGRQAAGAASTTVDGTMRFWNASGTLLASQSFSLPPHGSVVFNSSTVVALQGQSGTITVDHDGGYGQLSGKGVALEPATGFTFDTAMVPKFN